MDDHNIDAIFQQKQASEQRSQAEISAEEAISSIAHELTKDTGAHEQLAFQSQKHDHDHSMDHEQEPKRQKTDDPTKTKSLSSPSNDSNTSNIIGNASQESIRNINSGHGEKNDQSDADLIHQAHDQLQRLQQQQQQQLHRGGSEGPEHEKNTSVAESSSHSTRKTPNQAQDPLQDEQPTNRSSLSAIPSDSELFNTNAAHVAYSSLSSQYQHSSVDSRHAVFTSANLSVLPLPIVGADFLPPRIQLLINTLPTLDNLSTQLLRIVAKSSYKRIIDIASNPETPEGATYRDLTSLFEFTKRLYSEEDPFLTVDHVAPGMWHIGEETPRVFKNKEQSIESTLRKVNLATFLAAALGTMEVGFFYLNESFLDIFCPAHDLDIKYHLSDTSYLDTANSLATSIQTGVGSSVGAKIGRLLKPQAMLYLDLKTQAYISAIEAGERSREEILEDILPDNMDQILLARRNVDLLLPSEVDFVDRCKSRKALLLNYDEEQTQVPLSEEFKWFTFLRDLFDYVSKNMGYLIWGKSGKPVREKKDYPPISPEMYDQINARMNYRPSRNNDDDSDSADTAKLLPSEIREQQIHVNGHKPSQRRPWTRDEEKAFRHALELNGPHWSKILELFGKGGKINEALKNRNQVQLKDKARNWKVFYLKNGMELPSYLKTVTGNLEDRVKRSISRQEKTAAAPVPNVQNQKKRQQQEQAKEQEQRNQRDEDTNIDSSFK
ncbi:Tbf1 protein [Candida orthopsilosis Co 90-125]|uniref:Tbf1 protein n=1 Tax=Candida orthopsilosis (strain 90-125) TaxID=1136231 RepID=H8WXC0_CANO9|nr:Tbf1 protein [Candida orthopsilosis Co 90-125]CCG21425.1 Tbf1 protein [Candida orthopsilosis Co 90-125]